MFEHETRAAEMADERLLALHQAPRRAGKKGINVSTGAHILSVPISRTLENMQQRFFFPAYVANACMAFWHRPLWKPGCERK